MELALRHDPPPGEPLRHHLRKHHPHIVDAAWDYTPPGRRVFSHVNPDPPPPRPRRKATP